MAGMYLLCCPTGLWWEPQGKAITDLLTPLPGLQALRSSKHQAPSTKLQAPLRAQPLRRSLTGPHGKAQLQGPMAQGVGQGLGQLYISVLKEPSGDP